MVLVILDYNEAHLNRVKFNSLLNYMGYYLLSYQILSANTNNLAILQYEYHTPWR